MQLHDGTIINPTGLTLAPGMIVGIDGFNSGRVFDANEIDTPYNVDAGVPIYAGHPWTYYGSGISLDSSSVRATGGTAAASAADMPTRRASASTTRFASTTPLASGTFAECERPNRSPHEFRASAVGLYDGALRRLRIACNRGLASVGRPEPQSPLSGPQLTQTAGASYDSAIRFHEGAWALSCGKEIFYTQVRSRTFRKS